jgi:hypothetical protein
LKVDSVDSKTFGLGIYSPLAGTTEKRKIEGNSAGWVCNGLGSGL